MNKVQFFSWSAIKFGFNVVFFNLLLSLGMLAAFYALVFSLDFGIKFLLVEVPGVATGISAALCWVVILYFRLILARMALMQYDYRSVNIRVLFPSISLFLRYSCAEMITILAVIAIVVPLYWLIVVPLYCLMQYYVHIFALLFI